MNKQYKTSLFLDEIKYKDEKPMISVQLESAFTKEIRIVFKKGQVMKKHQTEFPIVVEVCQGTLDFGIYNQDGTFDLLNLKSGDLIALEGGVPHDLTATSDVIARLTLSKSDTKDRVDKVKTE